MINHNPKKNAIYAEKKLKISEADEQRTLFDWAKWNMKRYPDLEWLHHIPNGEYRPESTGKKLKALGVKPGVPDIQLPVGKRGYHGLYIELKSIGGRISVNQAKWLNALKKHGYFAVVAYGFMDAKKYIEWYLGGVDSDNDG